MGTRDNHAADPSPSGCVFCDLAEARVAWSSRLVVAAWDAFPVSPGHALILPRRHAASWGELDAAEKSAVFSAIDAVRDLISAKHSPAGFNVGFNDGPAAGQTIMHFHLHVIPRYAGDRTDPRGGVRWVLPDKAAYWADTGE